MGWRPVLAVTAAIAILASGCSFSLGSGGGNSKQSDGAQVQSMVKQEMQSPDTLRTMEDIIKQQQTTLTVDSVLKSPQGQKALQDELKRLMSAPEVQTALQEQMKKALNTPDMKKALSDSVKDSLMSLLTGKGGAGGGGGAGGEGGTSGSGGGTSGGS